MDSRQVSGRLGSELLVSSVLGMRERIVSAVEDLRAVSVEVKAAFAGLSTEQLNWKPDAKSWSVAQCLDHLIKIDGLYFPLFAKLSKGVVPNTFWEKYSPLSGFFGSYLIKVLSPDYARKVKTSKKAYPWSSEIDANIVERFEKHNEELVGHLQSLPEGLDLKRTIIASPLSGFVTYSLDDCITILTVHERRHLEQAKRVMRSEGFPR